MADAVTKYPCAGCIMRVGFGIKTAKRKTGIALTTARRLRAGMGVAPSKFKSRGNQNRHWEFGKQRVREKMFDWSPERVANLQLLAWNKELRFLGKQDGMWGHHPAVVAFRSLKYYQRNKRLVFDRNNKRRRENPQYRLKQYLRTRIYHVLKGTHKSAPTLALIGCSLAQLKSWIGSQFKRGMTWGNYGSKWELDHKIPCAKFDLTKPEEQRKCFHYSNLQPLWRRDNRRKWAKIVPCQPELIMSLNAA